MVLWFLGMGGTTEEWNFGNEDAPYPHDGSSALCGLCIPAPMNAKTSVAEQMSSTTESTTSGTIFRCWVYFHQHVSPQRYRKKSARLSEKEFPFIPSIFASHTRCDQPGVLNPRPAVQHGRNFADRSCWSDPAPKTVCSDCLQPPGCRCYSVPKFTLQTARIKIKSRQDRDYAKRSWAHLISRTVELSASS